MKYKQHSLAFFFSLNYSIMLVQTFKIKSYHFNKHSQTLPNYDCLQTSRNISIPSKFSLCFRHMKTFNSPEDYWGNLYIGSTNVTNALSSKIGLLFGYWDYSPWIGLYRPNSDVGAWVVPFIKLLRSSISYLTLE